MKPIVVVGSINMDLVSQTRRIPQPGETVLGTDFQMHSGGKGANQAVAAARLGQRCILLGMLGADIFATQLGGTLDDYGVETEHIGTANGPSGVASIVVDAAGENSIIVAPGANLQVTPAYLESKTDVLRDAGIVLTQLEVPLESVEWLAKFCKREGIALMLDPAPAAALPQGLLTNVTWFTPNQTEAEFYAGEGLSAEQTLASLLSTGVKNVILKRGAEGAIVSDSAGARDLVGAFAVKAVDTTAAGDAFNGAFATALMQGKSPAESARFAAAAAAISVTRHGAQPSLASYEEVAALLARN